VILSHGGRHDRRAGTYLPGQAVNEEAAQLMPKSVLTSQPVQPRSPEKVVGKIGVSSEKPTPTPKTEQPKAPEPPAPTPKAKAKQDKSEAAVPTSRAELGKLSRSDLNKLADELGVDASPGVSADTVRDLIATIMGM
jgi:hypothetical protein